jgi:hypothetical protein
MSLSEYNALASPIRAFWPPDKLVPFYPISVYYPLANNYKSVVIEENLTAWSNFYLLKGKVKVILSFNLADIIQGFWGTYAIDPFISTIAFLTGFI